MLKGDRIVVLKQLPSQPNTSIFSQLFKEFSSSIPLQFNWAARKCAIPNSNQSFTPQHRRSTRRIEFSSNLNWKFNDDESLLNTKAKSDSINVRERISKMFFRSLVNQLRWRRRNFSALGPDNKADCSMNGSVQAKTAIREWKGAFCFSKFCR